MIQQTIEIKKCQYEKALMKTATISFEYLEKSTITTI
jgi:hypothetical protein